MLDRDAVVLPAGLPAAVAALRGLDPALEEAAYSLGRSPLGAPSAGSCCRASAPGGARRRAAGRPAPARGVRGAADAAIPDVHDGDLRPVPLVVQRRRRPTCSPACSCCCCVLLLLAELRLRGRRGYARIGGGAPARPSGCGSARSRPAALAGVAGAGRLRARRPALQPGALARGRVLDGVPDRGAGRGDDHHGLARAGRRCGGHRAGAAGRLARRAAPRRDAHAVVERSTYAAHALPGIVVALALVTVSIRCAAALPDRAAAAARLRDHVPAAGGGQRPRSLEQAPPVLDDVARSLGLKPAASARRVTLPLIRVRARRRCRAGLPGRVDRADRDPAARPDRDVDPGDRVLVELVVRARTAQRRRTRC